MKIAAAYEESFGAEVERRVAASRSPGAPV